MSELTRCNYCGLERIKDEALAKKLVVTLVPTRSKMGGGMDVYLHPKDINIHLLRAPTRKQYWVSWMWAIGAKCEC